MNYYDKLKDSIGINRYNHSIRVRDTAVKLAKKFNCDINKTTMAGLLHDCGKYQDKDYILEQAIEFGLITDKANLINKHVIHAYLGAIIAQKDYGVDDKEILDAIRYHTTGKENMSLLEKIIYIADYIEPKRDFKGVDEVREVALTNIDAAMLKALENTIIHLLDKGIIIHPDTLNARNFLVQFGDYKISHG